MRAKIIFLDDEPKTHQRLRGALEKEGYGIVVPQTLEDAMREINVGGVELVVHAAHKTKTHWDICDGIFAQYPSFPSMHFATGEESEKFHRGLKGPFHYQMRPLVPEKMFLKRVRKLVFLGRLARENSALKKALALQNRIDKAFDSLEPHDLKRHMVDFFAKEFKAKNALFLSAGAYEYYLHEIWKVSALKNEREKNPELRNSAICSMPSTEQEVSDLLNKFAPQLQSGWEDRDERTFIQHKKALGHTLALIPLFGHQSKKILGHVILVDPLLYGDHGIEKAFPHLTRVFGRHLEHVIHFSEAKSLSYTDDLTDLYNQRYLKLVLDKEISRSSRTEQPFSVLFMDIDHFKQVNDNRGHMTGSQVLVELSKILQQNIRSMDYGFRYGGDEFILILMNTDSQQALQVAERIRKQVEASTFKIGGEKIKVTLSIGIAAYPEHAKTKEHIIELADRAMYCGKNKSRNIVYVAS